jgi:hypothetical protein
MASGGFRSAIVNELGCAVHPCKVVCSTDQFALIGGWQISSVLFSSLQKLKTLQVIRLDGCAIGEANLSLIGSGCKELKEFSLSKCQGVTDAGIVGVVTACTGLQKLDLTCCREITDVALEEIATNCRGLLSLKMENCLLVTAEGLVLIGNCCLLLEELDLIDCNLNDNGKSLICHIILVFRSSCSMFSYDVCNPRSFICICKFKFLLRFQ